MTETKRPLYGAAAASVARARAKAEAAARGMASVGLQGQASAAEAIHVTTAKKPKAAVTGQKPKAPHKQPNATGASGKPNTTNENTKPRRATPSAQQIDRQIRLVLTELMNDDVSASNRIAAAKVLIDKFGKRHDDEQNAIHNEREERNAAILEAHAVLAELALSKSGRLCRANKMD